MPYFNNRFKGVKSVDFETYSGYPSEFMHNTRQQKSRVYGGEYLSNLEDRKHLKQNYENATALNRVKRNLHITKKDKTSTGFQIDF